MLPFLSVSVGWCSRCPLTTGFEHYCIIDISLILHDLRCCVFLLLAPGLEFEEGQSKKKKKKIELVCNLYIMERMRHRYQLVSETKREGRRGEWVRETIYHQTDRWFNSSVSSWDPSSPTCNNINSNYNNNNISVSLYSSSSSFCLYPVWSCVISVHSPSFTFSFPFLHTIHI